MDHDRRAAFERVSAQVYEPLQRYLHRRCPSDEVDDVFNEVLLTLWRRLDDIPAEAPLPWSYGVARRCLANHRRGTVRRLRLVERVGQEGRTQREKSGATTNWVSDDDAALHDALGRLGPLDREVVRLWAWEQLEPREIAEAMETTPNAISVRLARIRRQLGSEMARQNPPEAGQKRDVGRPEVER